MKRQGKILAMGFGFLLFLLFASAPPASACTCWCDSICGGLGDCCPWCDGNANASQASQGSQVTVTPLRGQQVRIMVSGLQSMEMEGGSCGAGLLEVPGIKTVDSVRVINAVTGKPIYTFADNQISGRSFEELAEEVGGPTRGTWRGFQADVVTSVPDRVPSKFVIDVTLEKGVSLFKIANALRNRSGLGGGSANPDGSLDRHHVFLRDLKSMEFQIRIPPGKR